MGRCSRIAVAVTLAICVIQILTTLFDHSQIGTNVLLTITPLLAAAACYLRGRTRTSAISNKWRLFAAGLIVWAVGQGYYTCTIALTHERLVSAVAPDLWFLVYGIFVLLSVCSVEGEQDSRTILATDGLQALLAIVLIYATLFRGDHTGNHHPLAMDKLVWLYFVENLILAIVATVHLFTPRARSDRPFDRPVCVYAWLMFFVCSGLIYRDTYIAPTAGKLIESLWLLPFLGVLIQASSQEEAVKGHPADGRGTWAETMVYNASPVCFTVCVLLLGANYARYQPRLGYLAVFIALLIYTFRASILLTRLRRTQKSLGETRRSLNQLNQELLDISSADPLTQIPNRRRFEEVLDVEWRRAKRWSWPISILMLDIDNFKALNDRYGHLRGDQCLIAVAKALSVDQRRGGEFLARYGGEEFIAILPNVDQAAARHTAEVMRTHVFDLDLEHAGSPNGRLTVSVGVCTAFPRESTTSGQMIEAADMALYRAKANGRNRTEVGRTNVVETTVSGTGAKFLPAIPPA